MAAATPAGQQNAGPGADFWSAIGVGHETTAPNDQLVASGPNAPAQAGNQNSPQDSPPAGQGEWASLFDTWSSDTAAPNAVPSDPVPPAPAPAEPEPARPEPAKRQPAATKPKEPKPSKAEPTRPDGVKAEAVQPKTKSAQPSPKAETRQEKSPGQAAKDAKKPEAWATVERIASGLRSNVVLHLVDAESDRVRLAAWRDLLAGHTDGDTELATKLYDALTGLHVLGEQWRDEQVAEIHIRATEVTVTGIEGVRQVPGFPDLATARRTIETLANAAADLGVTVKRIGESTVLTRAYDCIPDVARLVQAGVISADLLSQVEVAVGRVQSVTVSGAAAPAVIRELASLVPPGSRVFEGPFGVLPAGCVAAASPLDADYVIGVRPGTLAEEMAAAGQIGALIANPQTQFAATVRLTVSGRTHSPETVAPW